LLLNSMAFGMILSVSKYVDKHVTKSIPNSNETAVSVENNTEEIEIAENGESVTQAEIPFDIAYTLDKSKADNTTI
jgi:hypothetical protein